MGRPRLDQPRRVALKPTMTNDEKNNDNAPIKAEIKKTGKQTAKMQREQRLANALRKNLSRRKQAKSDK